MRNVHESNRWKLFEKEENEIRLSSDENIATAEASLQPETEVDLDSESGSAVSELSCSPSFIKEICSKIDTGQRSSWSQQKARDSHRSPALSRDHSFEDVADVLANRGNERRRSSLVLDRNHKVDKAKKNPTENEKTIAERKKKEETTRDYIIEYERRRRNETVREEYERKLKEEAKIKKIKSKEAKIKDDLDRRQSISHIQLSIINPGAKRSVKIPPKISG